MASVVKGKRLHNGDEAVLFHIEVDGETHRCMVSRELLNDLSRSESAGEAILAEFDQHQAEIVRVTEIAIRGGLRGNPLLIPSEMFFPQGRILKG